VKLVKLSSPEYSGYKYNVGGDKNERVKIGSQEVRAKGDKTARAMH
jgi:hypothetical protein